MIHSNSYSYQLEFGEIYKLPKVAKKLSKNISEVLGENTERINLRRDNMTNAKPDNRSDNVRKIQNTIDNTLQNINEAEDYTKAHSEELSTQEKNEIVNKNERRRKSIDGLRSEIKDEASHNEYNNDLN